LIPGLDKSLGLWDVKANAELLNQMSKLGGKIEGNIFPIDQSGIALDDIRDNWESKFHNHFLSKN